MRHYHIFQTKPCIDVMRECWENVANKFLVFRNLWFVPDSIDVIIFRTAEMDLNGRDRAASARVNRYLTRFIFPLVDSRNDVTRAKGLLGSGVRFGANKTVAIRRWLPGRLDPLDPLNSTTDCPTTIILNIHDPFKSIRNIVLYIIRNPGKMKTISKIYLDNFHTWVNKLWKAEQYLEKKLGYNEDTQVFLPLLAI